MRGMVDTTPALSLAITLYILLENQKSRWTKQKTNKKNLCTSECIDKANMALYPKNEAI